MRLAPTRPATAVVGLAAFVLVAALVDAGVFSSADRFAAEHLMPWLQPTHRATLTVSSLALPDLHGPLLRALVDLWTYPAAVLPSLALVLAAAVSLRGRGREGAAAAWVGLWIAGNVVEVAGKIVLSRPAVTVGGVHVVAFDHSLPSGHTIRSLVAAAALASAWRGGRGALAWAATVPFALVALGAHTPTDVLAGAAVACVLAGWAPSRHLATGADGG